MKVREALGEEAARRSTASGVVVRQQQLVVVVLRVQGTCQMLPSVQSGRASLRGPHKEAQQGNVNGWGRAVQQSQA